MLYSILPPVIVVLSLVGIIVFMVKKASRVSRIEIEKKADAIMGLGERVPGMPAATAEVSQKSRMGNRLLIILERITRKTRLLFLKLENLFLSWSENIRKKRTEKINKTPPESSSASFDQEGIIEKVKKYDPGKKIDVSSSDKKDISEEEKIIRPMISEEVTVPQIELKDRLEKLLIERIAGNPKDTEAYERLGEYYFEIGNYEHSKECFKQVMKLNPKNINAKAKMRRLEKLLSKY